MNANIVICGAGGIGSAAALILACNKAMNPTIFLGDINREGLERAKKWVEEGKSRMEVVIHTFLMPTKGSSAEMDSIFEKSDVVLDCLPGSEAPRIASLCKKYHCHYANLTEYVAETDQIMEIAEGAGTGFLLQTGLAPGYINILACQLYREFKDIHQSDVLENMKMRVGALSENAVAPYFYAYTWSPIGVATEYVKDSIVVKNYKKQSIASLSDVEGIIINGELFEDSYTSGGAANLPDAFQGKVKNLDYKTLRYPGHYSWVKEVLCDLPKDENLPNELDLLMRKQIPSVERDRIIIYAHISGFDQYGVLRGIEKAIEVFPTKVGSKTMRGIQSTTASALCEAAFQLMNNASSGVILQSQVDPLTFLNGPYVSSVYGRYS